MNNRFRAHPCERKSRTPKHEQAQGLLNQVIDTAAKGDLAYSEFQRQAPDAMKRIELGLKARQNINEPKVGEDGAVSE